jgi:hypothetical protein
MFKNEPKFTEYLEFVKKYYTEKSVTGIKLENFRLCFYDIHNKDRVRPKGWIDVCCGLNGAIYFCQQHGLALQSNDLVFAYLDYIKADI